ncbi:MAG: DUF423 domain-containing protein [Bacteroidota bacterium]
MNPRKIAILTGAIFGFTGVIAGALGAHALEKVLEPEQLQSYLTAVRYQMYHALFLLVLGVLAKSGTPGSLKAAIWCAIIGTLMFSGSIYLLIFTSLPVWMITPMGGTVLIVAWALVAVWALRHAE